ncbi:acylphosphatase [Bradyrhizobium sp.]|uniref:acylphosphatase n=1 Tax=Bradyrhizobium sp. TaxID=376 RepID=UPI001D979690|nr:acylphosphatase [Bradyrhizobium sp.]MBI5318283.1 acylphosphatase [Bradyrhizobium sp.]
MSHAILQVTIRGRVQGIGYRAWLDHQARQCKLEGWVRNRGDGSVEALFAGPPTVVAEMVALCRHGPPSARVDSVTSETADDEQLKLRYAGERFSVLPTI